MLDRCADEVLFGSGASELGTQEGDGRRVLVEAHEGELPRMTLDKVTAVAASTTANVEYPDGASRRLPHSLNELA